MDFFRAKTRLNESKTDLGDLGECIHNDSGSEPPSPSNVGILNKTGKENRHPDAKPNSRNIKKMSSKNEEVLESDVVYAASSSSNTSSVLKNDSSSETDQDWERRASAATSRSRSSATANRLSGRISRAFSINEEQKIVKNETRVKNLLTQMETSRPHDNYSHASNSNADDNGKSPTRFSLTERKIPAHMMIGDSNSDRSNDRSYSTEEKVPRRNTTGLGASTFDKGASAFGMGNDSSPGGASPGACGSLGDWFEDEPLPSDDEEAEGMFSEWRFELAGHLGGQPDLLTKMMTFMDRVENENKELRREKSQQMDKVNNLLKEASDTLCKQVNEFLVNKESGTPSSSGAAGAASGVGAAGANTMPKTLIGRLLYRIQTYIIKISVFFTMVFWTGFLLTNYTGYGNIFFSRLLHVFCIENGIAIVPIVDVANNDKTVVTDPMVGKHGLNIYIDHVKLYTKDILEPTLKEGPTAAAIAMANAAASSHAAVSSTQSAAGASPATNATGASAGDSGTASTSSSSSSSTSIVDKMHYSSGNSLIAPMKPVSLFPLLFRSLKTFPNILSGGWSSFQEGFLPRADRESYEYKLHVRRLTILHNLVLKQIKTNHVLAKSDPDSHYFYDKPYYNNLVYPLLPIDAVPPDVGNPDQLDPEKITEALMPNTIHALAQGKQECLNDVLRSADELITYKTEYFKMMKEYKRILTQYHKVEKSLDGLRSYVLRRGPILEDPLGCWADTFTPEICCSPWYGSKGHPGCWDGMVSYDKCCKLYKTTDTTTRHASHAENALPKR